MALDEISAAYANVFAAMRAKTGKTDQGASAGFATFLPDEAARAACAPAAPHSDIASRILQVGLVGYADEKKEVDKMMRVLALVRSETKGEVQEELDKIIEKFKANPPTNADDALRQIKTHIDALPPIGDLKPRMLKIFERIKELMAMPDDAFEKLEKEAQTAKMTETAETV